jgi:hypothetical protein
MTNPISASNVYVPQMASQAAPAKPAPGGQTSAPQDTVHLSSAAKAALGDIDHDGDSH